MFSVWSSIARVLLLRQQTPTSLASMLTIIRHHTLNIQLLWIIEYNFFIRHSKKWSKLWQLISLLLLSAKCKYCSKRCFDSLPNLTPHYWRRLMDPNKGVFLVIQNNHLLTVSGTPVYTLVSDSSSIKNIWHWSVCIRQIIFIISLVHVSILNGLTNSVQNAAGCEVEHRSL